MPDEWRWSVLVPIFKNKGDVQSCSNYRGIKFISHTMKLWERVVEARLRHEVTINEQQYGFMPRKTTTDAMFALRVLMEKYRERQKELHCVFVELETAYDKGFQEKSCGVVWGSHKWRRSMSSLCKICMRTDSITTVRCAVGITEGFKGWGWTASRIGSKSFLVCDGDGHVDWWSQAWVSMKYDVRGWYCDFPLKVKIGGEELREVEICTWEKRNESQ